MTNTHRQIKPRKNENSPMRLVLFVPIFCIKLNLPGLVSSTPNSTTADITSIVAPMQIANETTAINSNGRKTGWVKRSRRNVAIRITAPLLRPTYKRVWANAKYALSLGSIIWSNLSKNGQRSVAPMPKLLKQDRKQQLERVVEHLEREALAISPVG